MPPWIRWFHDLRLSDVPLVGGKNASLGELYAELTPAGIRVPNGFAITADAYVALVEGIGGPARVARVLQGIDGTDVTALARAGAELRALIATAPLPPGLEEQIAAAYAVLVAESGTSPGVAVRSSATAEDLPEASFAGQQETVLGVRGHEALVAACRRCFASLFTDRAIAYRIDHRFDHLAVRLAIGVQRMVATDRGAAGVMFTLDPESGFREVIVIDAAWGLGEAVVQGGLDPDEFWVFKPMLATGHRAILRRTLARKPWKLVVGEGGTPRRQDVPEAERQRPSLGDADVLDLARQAMLIEAHYSNRRGRATPMDIEWAKDGEDAQLYILQARPETVHGAGRGPALEVFTLHPGPEHEQLVSGKAVGTAVAVGSARGLRDAGELASFRPGEVLVAAHTDPDWEPIMKRAAAIVTDSGGRTCHAAIVSRELGVPCVIGTERATQIIPDGETVTVSCAQGDRGTVYRGRVPFERRPVELASLPRTGTAIMLNVGHPGEACRLAGLPSAGVGLARIEFIITSAIGAHPLALLHPDHLSDPEARATIERLTTGYADRSEYFVERLAEGVATIAAAFYPRETIVRLSDFKSNEYAGLVGGRDFEPDEENPMLGFRGAFRYCHARYREAFALECRAMRRVRDDFGLVNVKLMVPFCRTPDEGRGVIAALAEHGLRRGERGLEVYVMCEIPSNVVLAREFAEVFDGFSIGSNDLTQLVLGVDRDSALVAPLFDERNPAVLAMVGAVIDAARRAGRKIGICGQAPSDYPEFTRFLVERGITSISVNPDALVRTIETVADAERRLAGRRTATAEPGLAAVDAWRTDWVAGGGAEP